MKGHSIHSPDKEEKSKQEQGFSTHSLEFGRQDQSNIGRSIHQQCSR
jgi:hypothetical protein